MKMNNKRIMKNHYVAERRKGDDKKCQIRKKICRNIMFAMLSMAILISSVEKVYAANPEDYAYVYGFDYGDVNTVPIA